VLTQHEPCSASSDSRIAAALNEYLAVGGLPEVVLADPDLRPRIPEESYIVFLLPVAERSIRKRAMNPKKLHGVDWAVDCDFLEESAAASLGNVCTGPDYVRGLIDREEVTAASCLRTLSGSRDN
jgi:hypothetical protein